jgi:glycosyltransferase involved in cell wall biosynthesis
MSPVDPFRLSVELRSLRGVGNWFLSPGYNGPLMSSMPYVLTLHDLNHVDRPDNSNLAKRIYYGSVLRRVSRGARAILTVSEFSRNRIISWFGVDEQRVFNVGNGVSAAFSVRGKAYSAGMPYVLCVSNRRGHKNEAGVLAGFAGAGMPRTVKLVMTGDETPFLRAQAISLGLDDRLVFSGHVDEHALAALYRGALCLCFPSFYEGFGLPIIEAFACGTPVLSSTVTSLPEIAGDAALLVDPHDVRAISKALAQLHEDPGLRSVLISRGLRRSREFSWDSVARRVREAVARVDVVPLHPLRWN